MKEQIFDLENTNGKAKIIKKGDKSTLLSYNTKVATYNHKLNKINVVGWFSLTTGKHINLFFDFYGFDKLSKTELFKKYNLTK